MLKCVWRATWLGIQYQSSTINERCSWFVWIFLNLGLYTSKIFLKKRVVVTNSSLASQCYRMKNKTVGHSENWSNSVYFVFSPQIQMGSAKESLTKWLDVIERHQNRVEAKLGSHEFRHEKNRLSAEILTCTFSLCAFVCTGIKSCSKSREKENLFLNLWT